MANAIKSEVNENTQTNITYKVIMEEWKNELQQASQTKIPMSSPKQSPTAGGDDNKDSHIQDKLSDDD